ncbi:hypothetical protein G9A89_005416 [Geosiphon pyriformis]|nr:hypothetical protein G9A89_005416 [Geosiphon pyriformis]
MEELRHPLEERLKPETDFPKTRLKAGSPTGSTHSHVEELENRNFTLEEEVKDLRIQLNGRQNEIAKAQELLNKRTVELEQAKADYYEKMKKMRNILIGANKNLTDLRQTVASKEAEIAELKESLQKFKEKEEQAKSTVDEIEKSASRLSTELLSQAALYTSKIEQLESRLKQSNQQFAQVKTEFQQYKQRAHALLQEKTDKVTNNDTIYESKDSQSEYSKKRLEEISSLSLNMKLLNEKLHNAEKDRGQAFELKAQVEKELLKAQQNARQNAKVAQDTQQALLIAQNENQNLKEELSKIQNLHNASVQDLKKQLDNSTESIQKNLNKKQEENEELQRISEHLSEELSQVRAELSEKLKQLDEIQKEMMENSSTSRSRALGPPSNSKTEEKLNLRRPEGSRSSSPISTTGRFSGSSTTLSDLLTDVDDRRLNLSNVALSYDKEKEFTFKMQHMGELLNESEAQVKRLEEQEKVLKEEIRKMDRLEKRQDLNVEYLKNVVLRFLETTPEDREPLIPVISAILQLSPEETKNLRNNVLNLITTNPVVLGFGLL